MKHTPGPWIAEINDKGQPCIVTANEPYAEICSMENMIMPMVEMVANTRLVASAPDMMRALKLVIQAYDSNLIAWEPHMTDVIDAARAVLKTAGVAP